MAIKLNMKFDCPKAENSVMTFISLYFNLQQMVIINECVRACVCVCVCTPAASEGRSNKFNRVNNTAIYKENSTQRPQPTQVTFLAQKHSEKLVFT